MDIVTFKGITSRSLGLIVETMPNRVRAKRDVDEEEIPGRDGVLHYDNGRYEAITFTVTFNAFGRADARAVNEWLSGSGDLIFSDEADKCYHAHVIDEVQHKRQRTPTGANFDSITAKFDCEPYAYESDPDDSELSLRGPTPIDNIGTVEALPLITITFSGQVVLTVGDVRVMLDGSGTVTIDCDAKTAYRGTKDSPTEITLLDELWPVLPTGETRISWTGSASRVIVRPNWRWL